MNFKNQFELFGEANKPTKEALRTGPEEELSLPELQAKFKTLTGYEASAYKYNDSNELKLFISQYKDAPLAEIISVLVGRAGEQDRDQASSLEYWQR